MKKFKGKPGPWHWEGKVLCNDAHIVGGDGWTFNDADKSLISAAPELLEVLQEILQIGDIHHSAIESKHHLHNFESWEMKATAAINKALGE